MTKRYFKYREVKSFHRLTEYELNEFGVEGWELVSITPDFVYTFKTECGAYDIKEGYVSSGKVVVFEKDGQQMTTIRELYANKVISTRLCSALMAHGVQTIEELVNNTLLLKRFSKMRNFGAITKREMESVVKMIKESNAMDEAL